QRRRTGRTAGETPGDERAGLVDRTGGGDEADRAGTAIRHEAGDRDVRARQTDGGGTDRAAHIQPRAVGDRNTGVAADETRNARAGGAGGRAGLKDPDAT